MHGIGVSAVSAYTAHREWATRAPDERHQSVQALHDARLYRRSNQAESRLAFLGHLLIENRYGLRQRERDPARPALSNP